MEEETDIGQTSVSPRARGRDARGASASSFGAIKRSKLVTAFLESFEIVCGLVAKISKGPSLYGHLSEASGFATLSDTARSQDRHPSPL